MKITKFNGKKINEFIDFDIDFNQDLSILTGTNGSGKTTALVLMQGILCPNLEDLILVPFETLELTIEYYNIPHNIFVKKNKNTIAIRINNLEELIIENISVNDVEYFNFKNNETINLNEILLKKYDNHPVIKFIKELPSPIFIGLERTTIDVRDDYKNYLVERNIYFNKNKNEITKYRRNFKGTLGVNLLETELLIQTIYKRLKAVEDRYSSSIQKQLISSSFDYLISDLEINSFRDKQQILSRRSEIEISLKKIGLNDKELFNKISSFFEKITQLFRSLETSEDTLERSNYLIEWLLNKSQFDRLLKLVEILDEYNSKVKETYAPLNNFIDIINSFFRDSGKRIYVDEVGRLFVKKPHGKDLSIDGLSSGERQLIILFANVIFTRYKNPSNIDNILIIDEPEVSLHIRWQEKFIESLFAASENTQFILATHSPDIVADYKQKSIRLTRKQ